MLIQQLKIEAEFYLSVISSFGEVEISFNNNYYWQIHDFVRNHKSKCESFYSVIWGLSVQTVTDHDPFNEHAIICIRKLYRRSILEHQNFLAKCISFSADNLTI